MGIPFLGRWLGRSPGRPGKPALGSTAESHAAQPEDAEAQLKLGRRFANGEGVDRDFAQAAQWFLKAANQGHCTAQFNLGQMYGQGHGVQRNEVTSLLWLRKAADLGHPDAQYHIGLRQQRASKGSQEPEASECRVEAFKWLHLARAQGHKAAQAAQEFLALGMTREEVTEGGRRAGVFTLTAVKLAGEP